MQNLTTENKVDAPRSIIGWKFGFALVVFVAILLVRYDKVDLEKLRRADHAAKAKSTLLQLVISENDYYGREGHWYPRLDIIYQDYKLDTTYYRFIVDTTTFTIRAERRDGLHNKEMPQVIAINRFGLFIPASTTSSVRKL